MTSPCSFRCRYLHTESFVKKVWRVICTMRLYWHYTVEKIRLSEFFYFRRFIIFRVVLHIVILLIINLILARAINFAVALWKRKIYFNVVSIFNIYITIEIFTMYYWVGKFHTTTGIVQMWVKRLSIIIYYTMYIHRKQTRLLQRTGKSITPWVLCIHFAGEVYCVYIYNIHLYRNSDVC